MANSELKPCPFCGGEAEIVSNRFVKCKDCRSRTWTLFPTLDESIKAWNTRAERTCNPYVKAFKIGENFVEYQAICDCGYPVGVDGTPNLEDFEHIENYCGGCGAKVIHE